MRTAVLVTLLAALAAPAEARWERPTDPSEADIEAARALYERGLASIDALGPERRDSLIEILIAFVESEAFIWRKRAEEPPT